MAYLTEQLREVRKRIADRRFMAEEAAEARRREVEEKSDEIKKIDAVLASTARRIFEVTVAGGDERADRIEALRRENEELLSERRAILELLGYPADYTEIRYFCPACQDTGYNGMKMCACMKRELVLEGFRASGIGKLIEKQSFENFSLDYYKAAEDRALMEKNLAMAKEFAETTPPAYGNLLMVGGTGLGKTHLSTSIARRVIERGYEVRYDSVQNVLAAYEHDRFRSGRDEADDERSRVYVDAELLILDDLGTEMVNSFSLSSLYHLLNTRINQEKPTVISTNLMEEELQTKYSDRIFSRLLGEYKILLFRGTNVRYLKK